MKLIADSGSTKTEWVLTDKDTIVNKVITNGINPFFQNTKEIENDIGQYLIPNLSAVHPAEIYFYGAGCSFPEKKAIVKQALLHYFPDSHIEVESDLLGAAHALFDNRQGIACIMGTGSNSCYYNGREIEKNVSPLGFILGDEGSGASIAKKFVADCLKNQISSEIKERFFAEYALTPAIILDKVYKQAFPNRFLASFMPFISANMHEKEIKYLVYRDFILFFQRNIKQYDYHNLKVSFVGSVAFYFQDILRQAASECDVSVERIEKTPISGLIKRYLSKKKTL